MKEYTEQEGIYSKEERRRDGAVVVGGFSEAWHLLMCRERRSLARRRSGVSGAVGERERETIRRRLKPETL